VSKFLERVRSASPPEGEESTPRTAAPAVVLGNLVELWSLLDAASRTYAAQARLVPAPTRLLLWSLAHRRERHAVRLMHVIAGPDWAGPFIGRGNAAEYLSRWRADAPLDELAAEPVEALQATAQTEALIGSRCARLIAMTAHTLAEHALRWELADTRFAQHQIDMLLSMLERE
jgi:hypothetical protein